jgi:hypothetical protein
LLLLWLQQLQQQRDLAVKQQMCQTLLWPQQHSCCLWHMLPQLLLRVLRELLL